MKILSLLIIPALLACAGNLFAQAPSISYASSPAAILRAVAIGTAPNPTLNVTNSGGATVYVASTFAGSTSRTAGKANATGTSATFSKPMGITVDNSGNFYIADQTNNEIRKMTSAGVVTLFAGSSAGTAGRSNTTGSETFSAPKGITTDNTNLFVADSANNEIRKIVISTGAVTLWAGNSGGRSGSTNNTTGTSATFKGPVDIAYSATASALYVADYLNNEIRQVSTATGAAVTLLAGSTTAGRTNGTTTAAKFNQPAGIAVDPTTGNIYVADKGNNEIRLVTPAGVVTLFAGSTAGTAGSADGTTTAATFNAPTGITVDAGGFVHVYDSGTGLLREITPAGVVTTVAGAGTLGYVDGGGTTAKFKGAGLVNDASGNIFMADAGNNNIRKIIPAFTKSSALPAGLILDPRTGAVTGTATTSTAVTNYTVTANNVSGSSNTTLTLNTFLEYTWNGANSAGVWQTATNWTPNVVPGPYDRMLIGLVVYTYEPQIATTETIGSIIIGTTDNSSDNITVNGTLNVNGDITYQSDANSSTNNLPTYISGFDGTGTVNAVNFKMIANTTGLATAYQLKIASSVAHLNLSGDISLLTTYASTKANDASFTVSGGTVTATNYVTNNVTNSTSTLAVTGGTLNFTDPTALAGLSGNGTNTITLSAGTTIGYTGSNAQTVYTSTPITGLPSGISYQNLALSGSGIKTAASGNLNIAGDFTNSLANNVSNYFDASGATVAFNGTTQSIAGGSGNGTDFKTVTFSGTGTKTIASGTVDVISTGTLTLSGSTTQLAAGGLLTLRSDASGAAAVAAITSGSSITGNVKVERYLTGGASYSRGWRLLSSPVAASSSSAITPNLTYLHTNAYTTGSTGTGGGFDNTINPTFYFYRENMAPNTSSFISGNFRGVNKINNTPASTFSFDGGDANASLPVGNGFLFFFRGDRTNTTPFPPISNLTTAQPTILTATGYLNQGSITVNPWFPSTSGASKLSYTAATPASVQGFNLVGNPYASSIDWDNAGITKTAIATGIWIYNPKLKVYATYVPGVGGTNFNGGSPNIIPSGQGFFVRASSTSAALTFTEASKVSNQVPSANLLLAGASPSPLTYIRLVLSQDSLNKEEALISFKSTASINYVQDEDADYLIGESIVHISSRSADKHNLAINQMPFPASRLKIGLDVTVTNSGTYKLDMSEAINIPSRYKIYLTDTYKKDSVDITKQPVYTFTANIADTSTFGSNRFHLVIGQSDSAAYRLTEFIAAKSISGVSAIWKTVNESTNLTFTVERSNDGGASYSILGNMSSSGLGIYSFVDRSPQAGVNIYRLKQQDIFGGTSYNQVFINYSNGNTGANSVGVYPNPATSTIKLAVSEISKAIPDSTFPDYTIAISNSTGNIIKSALTSQPGSWQNDISTYAPGIYFLRVINNNTKTVVGNSKFVKL